MYYQGDPRWNSLSDFEKAQAQLNQNKTPQEHQLDRIEKLLKEKLAVATEALKKYANGELYIKHGYQGEKEAIEALAKIEAEEAPTVRYCEHSGVELK